MNKKYISAIMNIISVGESGFVFYCDHAAIGELDEKTGIFTDDFGNQYVSMLSKEMMNKKASQTYLVLTEEEEALKDTNHTLEEIITLFEEKTKNTFYYLGITEEGKAYFLEFDKNQLNNHKMNETTPPKKRGRRRKTNEFQVNQELEQLLKDITLGKYKVEDYEKIMNQVEITNQLTDKITTTILEKTKNTFTNTDTNRMNIEDIYNKVTKTLIAQDEPAKRVITEIARKEMDIRKKKEGILLVGPTGVGKTELMRLIAKYIDRPFMKVDSTQLTVPGYVGKDIEEVLWDLYVKCGQDLEKTEKAIIFFDEIDKKGSEKKSDVSGRGVVNVLLSFIEGATYDACQNVKFPSKVVKIDTSNMTVIFGGAFQEIYKKEEKKEFGFVKDKEEKNKNLVATKNFVDYAMMSNEFMSRVTVVRLNDLDVDSIKRIMLESDESAMKIQQEIFEKLGVKLTFTNSYTTRVAKDAYEKKTGARGLNGIIDESTWQAFNEVYTNPNLYDEIILDENVLEDSKAYQYVKKRKS